MWKRNHRIFSAAFLLFLSVLANAQGRKVVLSGYVRDAGSGEPLPQLHV